MPPRSALLRVVLTVVAISTLTLSSATHSDLNVRSHDAQKRSLGSVANLHVARQNGVTIPIVGDGDENNNGTTTTTGPTTTPTTTTTQQQRPPPPDIETTTTTSSTSTTTSETSTSATSTPSTSTTTLPNTTTRTTDTNIRQTFSYTPSARSSSSSQATGTDTAIDPETTPFLHNKAAVTATFTVVGVVAAGAVAFIAFYLRKRIKQEKNDDMWEDAASMAEFTSAGAGAAHTAAGLSRSSTIIPSTSAGGLNRTPSHYTTTSQKRQQYDSQLETTEEILAMPPVANYDRPRDSAFDIVPAAPPSAFNKPKRGPTTSFGSVVGNDPFAGTGFVDATRDSTFGPGEAGRGAGAYAGYAGGPSAGGYAQNQPSGYGYAGYGQPQQGGYGQQQQGGYGGYGYSG